MAKKNARDRSRSNGVLEMARERPVAAVAAAAGAAAAGLFLWSKRAQISDQLVQISDQIGEWAARSSEDGELETVDDTTGQTGKTSPSTSAKTRGRAQATPTA
jgi:hypothetical protein